MLPEHADVLYHSKPTILESKVRANQVTATVHGDGLVKAVLLHVLFGEAMDRPLRDRRVSRGPRQSRPATENQTVGGSL